MEADVDVDGGRHKLRGNMDAMCSSFEMFPLGAARKVRGSFERVTFVYLTNGHDPIHCECDRAEEEGRGTRR